MKLAPIKNAIVYKAILPDADALAEHLKEVLFTDLGESDVRRAGFVPNLLTSELVTPYQGGLSVSLRIDEKILPPKVISRELAERRANIERNLGLKLNRAEVRDLRDAVIMELVKQAFVKTTIINAYYSIENNLLIVTTGSKPFASLLISYLIKAVGSVKTETIHISDIKHGLTTKLKAYLDDDKAVFQGFGVGDFIQLSRKVDQKEIIRYQAEVESIATELQENLQSGYIVDLIKLYLADVSFLITENFHFKRIDLRDALDTDEEDAEDIAWRWRHEAAVATLQLTNVVNTLCILLSYKPTEKEINPQ
ncbi:recombination-associated protein RdgC [Rouxiella badensis]|uniref:recombination-associated protein RdgC n=1 Tax=Rouxiella badensis TaxID=1646377 RepID=UPI003C3E176C